MTPEESTPDEINKPPGHLMTFWTIFDHPIDAPHALVLRPQFLCDPHPDNTKFGVRSLDNAELIVSKLAWYSKDIDELRSMLPPGLIRMPRLERDPLYLLETWF
jgi:hypothetical protein